MSRKRGQEWRLLAGLGRMRRTMCGGIDASKRAASGPARFRPSLRLLKLRTQNRLPRPQVPA